MEAPCEIVVEDGTGSTTAIYRPKNGHPDGRAGVLAALRRALDRYGGPEVTGLPLFDAWHLAESIVDAMRRSAAPALFLTDGSRSKLEPPRWHYTIKPIDNGTEEAIYIEIRAPTEFSQPSDSTAWAVTGRFVVSTERPVPYRLGDKA